MRFLTWANDPSDPRCELLFKSAKHFGIELEPIGVGKEYRGGVSKIEWLAEALKDLKDIEQVCCTDSFDCLYVNGPAYNISQAYEDYAIRDNFVVYAGERWYRNRPAEYQSWYDERESSLYRYPNCGCVAGTVEELKSLLDHSSKNIGDSKFEQWYLTQSIAQIGDGIEIDYTCHLFYCCGGEWRRFQGEVVDGRFRNKRTGTYPYILHAPIPRRSLPIRERVARELGII